MTGHHTRDAAAHTPMESRWSLRCRIQQPGNVFRVSFPSGTLPARTRSRPSITGQQHGRDARTRTTDRLPTIALVLAVDGYAVALDDLPGYRDTTFSHAALSLQLNWYLR